MEILTDATLSKLLAECAKYENYVGAILFESRDREAGDFGFDGLGKAADVEDDVDEAGSYLVMDVRSEQ